MRRTKSGTPIAKLELDASRRMIEAALLTVGGFAMTTRPIGVGDGTIPAGEMVGIYHIAPGTPPFRAVSICWVLDDERTVAQVTVREDTLRPVTEIVLDADMTPPKLRA